MSLSVTDSRKAPLLAMVVPGVIGFVLSLTGEGAMLLDMAVFGTVSSQTPRRNSSQHSRRQKKSSGDDLTRYRSVVPSSHTMWTDVGS